MTALSNGATGERNVALGEQNVALGEQNVALGEQNVALGERNVALGEQNVAVGEQNVALGEQNVALGSSSLAQESREWAFLPPRTAMDVAKRLVEPCSSRRRRGRVLGGTSSGWKPVPRNRSGCRPGSNAPQEIFTMRRGIGCVPVYRLRAGCGLAGLFWAVLAALLLGVSKIRGAENPSWGTGDAEQGRASTLRV
ncbi:MAG: hypothetical protein KF757_08180 [Phycisphaeraceae bacterium]|nr:hypothetical protein [Phycisphaeraceae bacterium]MCW5762733.1 hypothetical protein [Phycisphaeraceae bacterium]